MMPEPQKWGNISHVWQHGMVSCHAKVFSGNTVQRMDSIEQAILYVKDHRNPGAAMILAKTRGVRQIDEGELLGWAFENEGDFHPEDHWDEETPSQDSNLPVPEIEPHLYFHPLPSGCYALCHQTAFCDPKSDSISLISHCLIITPRLLRAFRNDVLALHKALTSREDFHFLIPHQPVDPSTLSLSPIHIGIRHTPVINTELLEAMRDYPGAAGFANLLSLSVHSVCTIFTWLSPSISLIRSIIQCLPVSLRPELTFATSLHFSPLRPLRLIATHENSRKAKDICRRFAVPFFHTGYLDVTMLRERVLSHPGWAAFVYHILDRNACDSFAHCMTDHLKSCSFETQHGTVDWNMLNQVGKSLLDLWDSDGIEAIDDWWRDIFTRGGQVSHKENFSSSAKSDECVKPEDSQLLRGDFSHERFQSEIVTHAESKKPFRSSQISKPVTNDSSPTSQRRLASRFPKHERDIRQLDSLIARSLFGDALALEALDKAWKELRKHLTFHETETIRETYIHLIQSIIVLPRDPDYPKPPRRTLDSLDVMNIFLQE